MTTHTTETSPRRAAIIAGAGYVTLFVLGIFSNFFVLTALIEPGDTAATFTNIAEAESLFRMGIMGFLIVFLVDVIVAWALYVLFREVARDVSLLAAWFRLIYTVFLGVALIFRSITLQLIGGADYETLFLTIVAVPAVIGELAFTLWLLFKAGRLEVTERPKVAAGTRV